MNVTLTLRGDQIARFTSLSGNGNGAGRVVTVTGVRSLDPAATYTVLVEQVSQGQTQFTNGQFVTIFDAAGAVVMPRVNIMPDIEQNLGAGDEHLLIPGPNFLIDLGGLPVGPQTVFYTMKDEVADPAKGDNDGELDFADFVCFAAGARIATPDGERAVEDLRPGDLVMTLDHGAQPLVWTGARTLTFFAAEDPARPVVFPAGALGPGLPRRELRVSPRHRLMLGGEDVREACGSGEALAMAKALAGLPGARRARGARRVTYVTLLLARHEIVFAEGAPAETLYPGPVALQLLGEAMREEVLGIMPQLRDAPAGAYGPTARPLMKRRQAEAVARGRRRPLRAAA